MNSLMSEVDSILSSYQHHLGKSNQHFLSIDPATLTQVAEIPDHSEQQVDSSIQLAREAFTKSPWKRSISFRKEKLKLLADLMEKNIELLAQLDTLDMGMPIKHSTNLNVKGAITCLNYYLELIDKTADKIAPTEENLLTLIKKEPIGVVAAIVAWNVPLLVELTKVAPALAAGNAVILKPAEESSLSAMKLQELAIKAGIPEGIFQVLTGKGETVGKLLAKHHGIDCITFTGSTSTGKEIMKDAGDSNLKKVCLECGGKSPNIILSNYMNLEKAAEIAAQSIFFNSGQVCVASSRLLIEKKIYDEFMSMVIKHTVSFKPGNPFDSNCLLGPLASKEQYERVESYINIAREENLSPVLLGKLLKGEMNGYFIEPSIYAVSSSGSQLVQNEIFGPILCAQPFESVEEAALLANDTQYGLGASIWGSDFSECYKLASEIQAGLIRINSVGTGGFVTPFGGYKQSGIGRDKSPAALEEYQETKAIMCGISDD